jgi:hypothetical protein
MKLLRICAPWAILEVLVDTPKKMIKEDLIPIDTALEILNDVPQIDLTSSAERLPAPISGTFLSMCYLEALILSGKWVDQAVPKLIDLYCDLVHVSDLNKFGNFEKLPNVGQKWTALHQKGTSSR